VTLCLVRGFTCLHNKWPTCNEQHQACGNPHDGKRGEVMAEVVGCPCLSSIRRNPSCCPGIPHAEKRCAMLRQAGSARPGPFNDSLHRPANATLPSRTLTPVVPMTNRAKNRPRQPPPETDSDASAMGQVRLPRSATGPSTRAGGQLYG
jgi:hypothetical protein